ncbi:hypothetical protein [Streptomyces luteireticuli]
MLLHRGGTDGVVVPGYPKKITSVFPRLQEVGAVRVASTWTAPNGGRVA